MLLLDQDEMPPLLSIVLRAFSSFCVFPIPVPLSSMPHLQNPHYQESFHLPFPSLLSYARERFSQAPRLGAPVVYPGLCPFQRSLGISSKQPSRSPQSAGGHPGL